MWNYLTPFQVIYEPARRYPEIWPFSGPFLGTRKSVWIEFPKNWDYGIVDHLNA
jgi:hypothetical protein